MTLINILYFVITIFFRNLFMFYMVYELYNLFSSYGMVVGRVWHIVVCLSYLFILTFRLDINYVLF